VGSCRKTPVKIVIFKGKVNKGIISPSPQLTGVNLCLEDYNLSNHGLLTSSFNISAVRLRPGELKTKKQILVEQITGVNLENYGQVLSRLFQFYLVLHEIGARAPCSLLFHVVHGKI